MLPITPLQMCSAGKSGPAYLTDFQFVEAFTCTYADSMGMLVFGLMFFGGISIAIYNTTGDIRVPAVLLLLTGGVVLPFIAAPGIAIAVIVILTVGAGVVTYLYYRYSR